MHMEPNAPPTLLLHSKTASAAGGKGGGFPLRFGTKIRPRSTEIQPRKDPGGHVQRRHAEKSGFPERDGLSPIRQASDDDSSRKAEKDRGRGSKRIRMQPSTMPTLTADDVRRRILALAASRKGSLPGPTGSEACQAPQDMKQEAKESSCEEMSQSKAASTAQDARYHEGCCVPSEPAKESVAARAAERALTLDLPAALKDTLRDLLELEDVGERVKWPDGYDSYRAKTALAAVERRVASTLTTTASATTAAATSTSCISGVT